MYIQAQFVNIQNIHVDMINVLTLYVLFSAGWKAGVGVTVGLVAVVALVIAGYFLWRRQRERYNNHGVVFFYQPKGDNLFFFRTFSTPKSVQLNYRGFLNTVVHFLLSSYYFLLFCHLYFFPQELQWEAWNWVGKSHLRRSRHAFRCQ